MTSAFVFEDTSSVASISACIPTAVGSSAVEETSTSGNLDSLVVGGVDSSIASGTVVAETPGTFHGTGEYSFTAVRAAETQTSEATGQQHAKAALKSH